MALDAPAKDEGGEMEAEEGPEPASEDMEEWEAGRARQGVPFLCFFFLRLFFSGFLLFFWRDRGKEIGEPFYDRACRSGTGYDHF